MAIEFAASTPEAAKRTIESFLSPTDLAAPLRAAILRLASYPAMTELWREKLPRRAIRNEADLVTMAILAYAKACELVPPPPRPMAAFAEHVKQHRLLPDTLADIASQARHLRDRLARMPTPLRSRWAELSARGTSFEQAGQAIEDIVEVCDRLDAENREILAALNFPKPPRRRGAAKAQRTYFGRIMSGYFVRTYEQPFDPAVTTLEDVLFDLAGEIEATTARSRRRGVTARRS